MASDSLQEKNSNVLGASYSELAPDEAIELGRAKSDISYENKTDLAGVIKCGIARLDIACGQTEAEPNPLMRVLWAELLGEIPLEKLKNYFKLLEGSFIPTSACRFPSPAHILQMWQADQTLEAQKQAEQAWQDFLKTLYDFYHPEMGWKKWAPKPPLPDKTVLAAKAAGGLTAIYLAKASELVWTKKEFLAAYLQEKP